MTRVLIIYQSANMSTIPKYHMTKRQQ